MSLANTATPVIARADAGLILISYWTVPTAGLQRHAAALAMQLWQDTDWPDGMLSHHVYGADDGKTVLNYSQWRDDAAFDAYLAGGQPERARRIEADPAGISRDSIDRFRIYRTMDGAAAGSATGCLVLTSFDVDGPSRQRQLVDSIIAAATSVNDKSGNIASHFHINHDGSKVINVAEWVNAQSHASTVQTASQQHGIIHKVSSGAGGVTARGFQRFVLLSGVAAR
ncbi:hypothetical protein [Rheinheimera sp. NSM]|uniref:hypothetical protein n=1 Tax=Rheinheimera sp. NSM TaxID=3457884 RepID=UPI0040364B49